MLGALMRSTRCTSVRDTLACLLAVDDLGDRAGGAGVLANATGDAGILVGHGRDVLELEDALGAGVDADATGDALIGIDYGMCHGISSLRARRVKAMCAGGSKQNITRRRVFARPLRALLHTVRRVCQSEPKNAQFRLSSCKNVNQR